MGMTLAFFLIFIYFFKISLPHLVEKRQENFKLGLLTKSTPTYHKLISVPAENMK